MGHRQVILRPERCGVGLVGGRRDSVRDGAIVAPPGPHVSNARATVLRRSRGNGVARTARPGKRLCRTVSSAVNGERETRGSCLDSHLNCRCRCSSWRWRWRRRWPGSLDSGEDIDPAPAIDVVWRARSATQGGSDMNSRVIQGVAARSRFGSATPEWPTRAAPWRQRYAESPWTCRWQSYRHYRRCCWPSVCSCPEQ